MSGRASTSWRDSSLQGAWGRPKGGGHRRALWIGGNCFKSCIATLLQRPIETVPDPTADFAAGAAWLDRYEERLKAALGLRLEEIPASGCPPVDRSSWIAILEEGEDNHAVLARQGLIWHDPNHGELGGLPVPRDRIVSGFRLVPANAPRRDRWGRKVA